jgi:ATP-dependent DNA helicase RecG
VGLDPPTSPEQIDVWRSADSETERLEFKEAKQTYDSVKLREYCVAIANEGGGHLLFGIANEPPRKVVGTIYARSTIKLAKQLFDDLGFRVDVEAVNHPEGRVLVFKIPPRPRGMPCSHDGKYLMRCGESLVPMTPDRIRQIFDEGKTNWLDGLAATSLLADEVEKLLHIPTYFSLAEIPKPSDRFAALARLEQDGLIECRNNLYSIKRYAAIVLAQRLSAFPELEGRAPRIVVYNGTSKRSTKLERFAQRGYAVGFRKLVQFIGEQLPQNEVIENAFRRKIKLVPDEAIRELIANALVHQDFNISGSTVMIEIYTDRVEISNPGSPSVPTERFIDCYRSRNEHLASLMRKLRICEEKGSGIDRVIEIIEVMQLPAPLFREGYQNTIVTIFGSKQFSAMRKVERMRACYQHCALQYVMHKEMTNQSLRNRFRLPENKAQIISQIISATLTEGFIKADENGSARGRFASYVPFWA